MLGFHLLIVLHAVSATLLVGLLVLAIRNRRQPVAAWLGGVLAALLLWTVGYVCELAGTQPAEKLAWANLQFVGATTLPVLWLVAARIAVGRPAPSRRSLGLLFALAAAIIVCVYANPAGLFRGQPWLDSRDGISFLAADYGLLYYLTWVPFAYGLLGAALVGLGRAALGRASAVRVRARLLLAATALPMLAGACFVAGALPWPNFNPTMASLSVAVMLAAVALIRGRLFSITPLARALVIEQLADGVLICDGAGCLADCNPAARALLPELGLAAQGRPLAEILAGQVELARALAAARQAQAAGQPSFSCGSLGGAVLDEAVAALWIQLPDGLQVRHLAVTATPVLGRRGRCLGEAIVLRDVTGSVDRLRHAHRLATTDELTGLATRRQLLELASSEIDRARRTGEPLAVLLLDLDHFKTINDRYGHPAGDELLRAVARACRAQLRSFDLLGRYGGDELAALLPNLDQDQALLAAERLRHAVEGVAIWQADALLQVTVSIGVACGGGAAEMLSDLIEAADRALYEAKAKGGNAVASASMLAVRGC